MIKISYPDDLEEFKIKYLEIFNLVQMEQTWTAYKQKYNVNIAYTIEEILVADFETLFDYCFAITYPIADNKFKYLQKLFDYKEKQPKIAKFFMQYKDELKLATCYYCNIDFVNTFQNSQEYFNTLDFINNANLDEITQVIGSHKASLIIENRSYTNTLNILTITGIGNNSKDKLEDYQNHLNQLNHFTLDHLIDKAKNPIAALSIFNFIPSCYSCNSKFKKSLQFINVSTESYRSPTSENFQFNEEVKFKIMYAEDIKNLEITSLNDFKLYLDTNKSYQDYTNTFKLNERYVFHKNIVLEIITKKKEYSDSNIDEMVRIIGKSAEEIKKDLYGKEIFDGELQEKPFTKLKRDIYE